LVIHGHGGLDELTTSGPNRVSQLKDGKVVNFELDPAHYGLRPAALSDLKGGAPEENAAMLRALLSCEDSSPRRDVLLLNSAAALALEHGDFHHALEQAKLALDSGAALAKLDALVSFTQQVAL
jgi:anthranilate phosphoribosyltransferase